MKIRVKKHVTLINFWAIVSDDYRYLTTWKYDSNNFKFESIDEKYVVEKLKANIDHGMFLFESEEDAQIFLEYLEPIIIMEELTR